MYASIKSATVRQVIGRIHLYLGTRRSWDVRQHRYTIITLDCNVRAVPVH